MSVPAVPEDAPGSGNIFVCTAQQRSPETSMDQAVQNAGWTLFGPYQAGWGVVVIAGAAGYDGTCQPLGLQGFVFAHGVFAGTISPEPMNPGRTGQGAIARFDRSGLVVRYERFADSDPSCCPTRPPVDVVFQVTDEDGGPVLLPVQSNEVQATTH